ncbi:MAG TPA: zf-HC2 domain-containing protein [Thermoanaerobaculia bacterium]|nr:zf-HC2 domain-containing protein [Thermoanaerobaculia bacterium]
MNCNEANERLPWLLNGTLGEDERRQVMAHLKDCADCRTALRETRQAWQVYNQHIPSEDLVAYAWGAAPVTVDPGLLEEHLASCPQCAAELELVRMSRRLEEDDKIAVMPARRQAPAAGRTGFWRAAALAASLAAVVGLGGVIYNVERVQSLENRLAETQERPAPATPPATDNAAERERLAQLQGEIEKLRQSQAEQSEQARQLQEQLAELSKAPRPSAAGPKVNAFFASVTALGATVRGGPGAPQAEKIPASAPVAYLQLIAERRSAGHPVYEMEIVDAAGKVRWSAKNLERNDGEGEYSLILDRGALPPGSYTVQVYGVRGGAREPLESYAIQLK